MIDLYEWKDGCSYDIKPTIYNFRIIMEGMVND